MSSTGKLTAKQIRLIRESFESVREYEDSVAVLFYGRLFEIAPDSKALFKIDIRAQAHKLMETLQLLVAALDRFEELRPTLEQLGRSHVDYGVQPLHYQKLGLALMWALGQALSLEFDRETREAWGCLLTEVSAVMLAAASSAGKQAQ